MKIISFISYWLKQTLLSWIAYIFLLCFSGLVYFRGIEDTSLMIAGGMVASSIFYLFLVKIPDTRHAKQMSRYTRNLYLYKKNIIKTIIHKCVSLDESYFNNITNNPEVLTEYLSKSNNSVVIVENIFQYKEQLLNELSFLFLTLSRYVNLDFVLKDINLFNITNDYIIFLENVTLSLTTLEKHSDQQTDQEVIVKTLTELLCGSTLLLSVEEKDFFIQEIDKYV